MFIKFAKLCKTYKASERKLKSLSGGHSNTVRSEFLLQSFQRYRTEASRKIMVLDLSAFCVLCLHLLLGKNMG